MTAEEHEMTTTVHHICENNKYIYVYEHLAVDEEKQKS